MSEFIKFKTVDDDQIAIRLNYIDKLEIITFKEPSNKRTVRITTPDVRSAVVSGTGILTYDVTPEQATSIVNQI